MAPESLERFEIMDYFELLDLKKEPFSNSPDPEFFYGSRQHLGCLQQLELSIRLRRGLNVVVADVGMGKTTLCRQLLRRFNQDKDVTIHLLLDPSCADTLEFLTIIAQMMGLSIQPGQDTERRLKEKIKDHLFHQGVEKGGVTALVIDEGQKLPVYAVEVLREFLNYETNSSKLLQIVIFAQKEFDALLANHKNFADRVSLYLTLHPFSYAETKAMVRYRLREAAEGVVPAIFTSPGYAAMHASTQGYPRRIVELGYRVLLALILKNKRRAGWRMVRACARSGAPRHSASRLRPALLTTLLLGAVAALLLTVVGGPQGLRGMLWGPRNLQASAVLAPPSLPASAAVIEPEAPQALEALPAAKAPPAPQALPAASAPPQAKEPNALTAPPAAQGPEPPKAVRAVEKAPEAAPAPAPIQKADKAMLTNMWGGRFPGYSQIVFWFDGPVSLDGPKVDVREALLYFEQAGSQVAPFRQYNSFPGWVSLKQDRATLIARIGLPDNLDGLEHFVVDHPHRVIVNLYHDMKP